MLIILNDRVKEQLKNRNPRSRGDSMYEKPSENDRYDDNDISNNVGTENEHRGIPNAAAKLMVKHQQHPPSSTCSIDSFLS